MDSSEPRYTTVGHHGIFSKRSERDTYGQLADGREISAGEDAVRTSRSLELTGSNLNTSETSAKTSKRFVCRKPIVVLLCLAITVVVGVLLMMAMWAFTGKFLYGNQKYIKALQQEISDNTYTVSKLESQLRKLNQSHNPPCDGLPTPTTPTPLCSELPSSSPSGYYWVTASNGSAMRVFCDMTRTCGPFTGGWMRVASVNVKGASAKCPVNLCLDDTPVRGCYLCSKSYHYPFSLFRVGVKYSKVCGKVIGYAIGHPDAFSSHYTQIVDGVILSYSLPPVHIWTFVASIPEPSRAVHSKCACSHPFKRKLSKVPDIIGENYFCDHSFKRPNSSAPELSPLWDGVGCRGLYNRCCTYNNPPWFYRELPSPTYEDIWMKINLDEDKSNEDIAVEQVEIYVQ